MTGQKSAKKVSRIIWMAPNALLRCFSTFFCLAAPLVIYINFSGTPYVKTGLNINTIENRRHTWQYLTAPRLRTTALHIQVFEKKIIKIILIRNQKNQ